MIGYLRKKVARWKEKRTFKEYGFRLLTYRLERDGEVQFAEWLHTPSATDVITQEKVDFYRTFIREGDLVIDIGAHEGDTTVPMALAAGKQGTVLGIDPNPHVFKVLTENAKLNPSKTNIIALNFAATAEDGEFTFGSGDASFANGGIVGFSSNRASNHRYTFTVHGKNLVKYLNELYTAQLPRLSFIKTDTEGYDKEILKNIAPLFGKYRPVVVSECFSQLKPDERSDLHHAIACHGYAVYNLADYQSGKREALSANDMTRWRHFDVIGIPKERDY
jgi:FkbM family methyltransferase